MSFWKINYEQFWEGGRGLLLADCFHARASLCLKPLSSPRRRTSPEHCCPQTASCWSPPALHWSHSPDHPPSSFPAIHWSVLVSAKDPTAGAPTVAARPRPPSSSHARPNQAHEAHPPADHQPHPSTWRAAGGKGMGMPRGEKFGIPNTIA